MEGPTVSPRHAAPASSRWRRFPLLKSAAVGSGVAVLVWSVVVLLCSNRGLNTTDESFYLLTYRWWDVNFDTFTGAQYFYGPIFELLGHDVPRMRVARLVLMLAAHGCFGWAFMRWLRVDRPTAPDTRWWEAAGTAAVVACAGIVYSWLPLSPGYNDLSLTGTVLVAAAALRMGRDARIGVPTAAWVPVCLGVAVVFMVLGKWSSSSLVLLCAGLAVVVVVWRQGVLALGRLVALTAAGAAAGVGFIHLVLVRLDDAVPGLVATNRLVAASTNSPQLLLDMYLMRLRELLDQILDQHWPLLVAAAVIPLLWRAGWLAALIAGLALTRSAIEVVTHDGLRAGSANLPNVCVTVFTPLLVLVVAALSAEVARLVRRRLGGEEPATARRGPRELRSRLAMLLLVLALPVAQAAGTGNPLQYMAMMGLGLWMAAIIVLLTRVDRRDLGTRTFTAGLAAALVGCTAVIAVDGLWNHPYATTGHDASTTVAAGVPALDSIRLDPATAATYARLHELLAPWVTKPGRAMMAFDGMAGQVLLLDGRPVGDAWYGSDIDRTIASIVRQCDGSPWWGDRSPVLLFNRLIDPREVHILHTCGLDLRKDYELLADPDTTAGISVYAPVAASARP